jgi:hypothetical protein
MKIRTISALFTTRSVFGFQVLLVLKLVWRNTIVQLPAGAIASLATVLRHELHEGLRVNQYNGLMYSSLRHLSER